ncbi:MAG: hypothetical protein Q8936_10805 [Bacillota bacterium]|nr:hypothetical protein [Bacillota bacterium]
MKKNKWLVYCGYAVLILGYIIVANKILAYQYNLMKNSFDLLPFIIWSIILYAVLGVLFGLEKLICEIRKDGSWKINLPKLIFLGIPSFLISLSILLLHYPPITFIQQAFFYPIKYLSGESTNFISIVQVAFGYILCTSFFKVKKF